MRRYISFMIVAAMSLVAAVSCRKEEPALNQFANTVWMRHTALNDTPGFEAYRFLGDMTYLHWFEDDAGHVLYWYDSGYYEDRPDYGVIALDYESTRNVCAYSGNPPSAFLFNRDPALAFYRQNLQNQ